MRVRASIALGVVLCVPVSQSAVPVIINSEAETADDPPHLPGGNVASGAPFGGTSFNDLPEPAWLIVLEHRSAVERHPFVTHAPIDEVGTGVAVIPEPSTAALLGLGLAAMSRARRS